MKRSQKSPEPDKSARPVEPQAQPATDAATIRLVRELTTTQAELADLVSDMLVNGGERYQVEMIVRGALQHKWGLMFPSSPRDYAERAKAQKEFAQIFTERRYLDLVRSWPEEPPPQEEQPKPTAVLELARANIRNRLRFAFDEFIGFADPESSFFLMGILDICAMENDGHDPANLPCRQSSENVVF